MKKSVISIISTAMFIISILVAYILVENIMKPIRFNKEKKVRYDATKQRLIDIRTAQEAYKVVNGKYTGSFDTLSMFLRTDSFKIIKSIGRISDSLLEAVGSRKKAEKIALKEGIIKREPVKISVLDSLFKKRKSVVDSLRLVPFTGGKVFEMASGELTTGSQVVVKVFEAKVSFDTLLYDLDRQLVINYNEEREKKTGYAGLRVGSLTKASNNAGNWE